VFLAAYSTTRTGIHYRLGIQADSRGHRQFKCLKRRLPVEALTVRRFTDSYRDSDLTSLAMSVIWKQFRKIPPTQLEQTCSFSRLFCWHSFCLYYN